MLRLNAEGSLTKSPSLLVVLYDMILSAPNLWRDAGHIKCVCTCVVLRVLVYGLFSSSSDTSRKDLGMNIGSCLTEGAILRCPILCHSIGATHSINAGALIGTLTSALEERGWCCLSTGPIASTLMSAEADRREGGSVFVQTQDWRGRWVVGGTWPGSGFSHESEL